MKKLLPAVTAILLIVFTAVIPAGAEPAYDNGVIGNKSIGDNVVRVQLRLRELGYFMFKPTGSFLAMTVRSVIAFQQKQTDINGGSIAADGSIGPQSESILFSRTAVRADITAGIPFGATTSTLAQTGALVSWDEVKTLLTVGNTYKVIDCYSGTEFHMVFTGGENHAEMECASASDSATYKQLFGGEYNYSKRPFLIVIGDKRIAASLQGYPHGTDSVSGNEADGHSCMYFDGSLSHVGALSDIEHVTQVYKAAGKQ